MNCVWEYSTKRKLFISIHSNKGTGKYGLYIWDTAYGDTYVCINELDVLHKWKIEIGHLLKHEDYIQHLDIHMAKQAITVVYPQ